MDHHLGGSAIAPKFGIGNVCPLHHIQAVEPSHSNVIALAFAVGIEVGQKQVVAQVVVDVAHMEHHGIAIFVAMNEERHLVGSARCGNVGGMQASAVDYHHGIVDGTHGFEAIHPRAHIGMMLVEACQSLIHRAMLRR